MNRLIPAVLMLLTAVTHAAAPADALQIQKSWENTVESWNAEMRKPATPEARARTIANRPDATPYAKRMWQTIAPSLKQDWTLDPSSWFLVVTHDLVTQGPNGSTTPTFATEVETLLKSIEANHLNSPKLIPVCMALTSLGDPRALTLLEKIANNHPDPKIQGVAAISASMILKNLGDNPELSRKRLEYLRKAIIQSSDVTLGNTTVAKLAENELYLIRFLSKGRTAPDLVGTDSAGRPIKLSDMQGKIVLLLFWSSTTPDADQIIQITADMVKKFKGKPLVVLGVNHDSLDQLRNLEGSGTVTWKNFSDPENKLAAEYRIGSWPTVFVLDGDRKIHYTGTQGTFAQLTAEALLPEGK